SQEIEKFLESRVNADVEMVFPMLFAGVIESLRFGHADAAFMSAWPAALAQKHAGATVALAEIREVVIGQEKQEQPYYYSYWVVLKDSPYTKLEDLRGKKVAFSSQLSTSGYVFPLARLIEKGLVDGSAAQPDAKSFFGEVLFAGGYAQAWEALKKGQVDVAIIASDVSETLYREVLDGTKVIDQQGPIPSHAVIFSKDLEEPLRSELQAAFLELGKPENRALMRKFISGIFVRFEASDNEKHLAGLTNALNTTKLGFTETLR
ncbi:MAG: phosphate/phosphite/phosphonate ABC transporter substrate-binding protein, partial [Chloroflexota bacterium]